MSDIQAIKVDTFEDREAAFDATNSMSGAKKKDKRKRRKIVLNLKCPLCESGVKEVTYKDVYQLKKFTSVRGKIISTEKSGACSRHQRQITKSVKRARVMGLLAYVASE
jgi:small subunit ribosomal protein S18